MVAIQPAILLIHPQTENHVFNDTKFLKGLSNGTSKTTDLNLSQMEH